jgi:hypothetical protein
MDENIFIKSYNHQFEDHLQYNSVLLDSNEYVDSLESDEYDDMDISSSNSLSSIDEYFKFYTYIELYNYIESKTIFDGTYYNYSMNKDNHNVTFRMRDFRKIVDNVMHYHVNYPIKN